MPPGSLPAWSLLTIRVPAAFEEEVTALLLHDDAAARAGGLVVEDGEAGALAGDGPALGPDEIRIALYIPAVEAEGVAESARAGLAHMVALGILPREPETELRDVESTDWTERWKEFFHVTRVSPRIVVRPPWREYEAAPGDVVVEVEPGQAFGTGGHQTTQLCLRALDDLHQAGAPFERVLDVGCGSGVLAVAALLLGAHRAVGVDVDPAAVEASQENAARNGVAAALDVSSRSLAEVAAESRYPLVLANIIMKTLMELRDGLLAATAPGGHLVLSGLLVDQEDEFRAAFDDPSLTLVCREAMDDWLALTYRRAESSTCIPAKWVANRAGRIGPIGEKGVSNPAGPRLRSSVASSDSALCS